MCDNGSQVNLISQEIVQKLNEKPIPGKISFSGIGGNNLGSSLGEIYMSLVLKSGDMIMNKFYIVKNITNYSPSETVGKWPRIKNQLADPSVWKNSRIVRSRNLDTNYRAKNIKIY